MFIHPGDSPLHAGARVIPGLAVYRFELAAVDGYKRLREQLKLAAQSYELPAHLAYRLAIILPKICDGFEVRRETTGQPHQFDIALCLSLQPTAGLYPIEIPIDVYLEQCRWVVTGAAGYLWNNTLKPQITQDQIIHKGINDLDRIIFCDVIVESFGKQRALGSVFTFNKTLHNNPA